MRRISDILVDMEKSIEPDIDGTWTDESGILESLMDNIAEIREVVDHFAGVRGEGWAPFGTHLDCDVKLDFLGEDKAGMPLWERPAITHGDFYEDL